MFSFQQTRGPVGVAFTDRYAGPPGGALGGVLDLAEPPVGGDREGAVAALEQNLDLVGRALARGAGDEGDPDALRDGAPPPAVVRMHQVHGAEVHTVDRAWLDRPDRIPEVDGLVTDVAGVALLVRAADCVPVLLADVERRVVGAAHAGRLGLLAGVAPATLERMRALGADRVVAWVGPHVCGRCYEVPETMREEVAAVVPEAFAETSWGTPAVDVGAGVVAQLRGGGVEVVDAARCTREAPDLYSYRRDGAAAGRLGGLVWVRP